jgi:hypothetical protein
MMKKQRIFTLIAMGLAAYLLSAGLVLAKTEKIYFSGTRCRTSATLEEQEVDGRLKRIGGETFWTVDTGNELVDGEAHMYDTKSNREILQTLQQPPWYVLGTGYISGRVMITPDEVDGYWEGNFTLVWTGGGDVFSQLVAKGKGDLEGLTLVSDIENGSVSPNGILCGFGGWLEFYGYILNPGGKWEPPE